MYLNDANDHSTEGIHVEGELPCTSADGSNYHELSIHPLRLPEHLQSDHANFGWIVGLLS